MSAFRPVVLALLAAVALAGCPDPLPETLGDCPQDSTVVFADALPILEANCTRCHSSTLATSTERQAAPVGVDYDTRDAAIADPDVTWFRIQDGTMPNDADFTSDADALVLWEWLSCDGPE